LYFEHGAGNDGFCGQFFGSLEDGNGVVVFLNSEDGKILPEITNSVAKVYKWKNFYQEPRRKKTVEVADEVKETYKGIYLFDNTWAAIGRKDNAYHFYTSGMYVDMHFISPTLFINREFQAEKEIVKDGSGNSIGYTRAVNGREFPASVKVVNPDTLNLENNLFAEITWYLFETKQYDEALAYYNRAIGLYPDDLNLRMNMAHALLFKGDYEAALNMYKTHLNDSIRPGFTWRQSLLTDYQYFRDNKYDTVQLEKIMDYLNVARPK
jgi:tetratricopeptide (TPR) repeat protein